ncbi:hypothetical protein [Chitinimonas arctica]|nr:hypothetical protein [Chitinimonas arctica]
MNKQLSGLGLLSLLVLAGCGSGSETSKETTPPVADAIDHLASQAQPAVASGGFPVLERPVALSAVSVPDARVVDDATWDETAVRKVLQVFAWGGQPTDQQITLWANMSPRAAIDEILTFAPTNPKLSPAGEANVLGNGDGSLKSLGAYWSGSSSPFPVRRRYEFVFDYWRAPHAIMLQAAQTRGLNPVRYRIGAWEVSYHMVANTNATIAWKQAGTMYDAIQTALTAGRPYAEVMAEAATSAAITRQYQTYDNRIKNGSFQGNEDFAREFHQLFFGVLGTSQAVDTQGDYHESVTVKNTARMLTDITLPVWDDTTVRFGTQNHNTGALEILHQNVAGASARDKIFALAKMEIVHPDSLANLPIMIAQGLADDTLAKNDTATEAKKAELRQIWAKLADKPNGLLLFLRTYAISQQFHSAARVKYWTPLDHHMMAGNGQTLSQKEALIALYEPTWVNGVRNRDEYVVFNPTNNVFGHTTGVDASQNADVFRAFYNRAVNEYNGNARYGSYSDQAGVSGRKDWASVAPRNKAGAYDVKSTAEWLWQRFIADGLKNFGTEERQQVYALLGGGTNAVAGANLDQLGAQTVSLATSDSRQHDAANLRMNMAIGFILATPYAMVQQGR